MNVTNLVINLKTISFPLLANQLHKLSDFKIKNTLKQFHFQFRYI